MLLTESVLVDPPAPVVAVEVPLPPAPVPVLDPVTPLLVGPPTGPPVPSLPAPPAVAALVVLAAEVPLGCPVVEPEPVLAEVAVVVEPEGPPLVRFVEP